MKLLTRTLPLLLITLLVSGVALTPITVRAQLVVTDPGNLIQNTVTATTQAKQLTNPIFFRIAQTAIQSMVRSTVTWINSGFNGSPAYASDLTNTLQRLGDTVASEYLNKFLSDPAITSPFRDGIGRDVVLAYYLATSRDGFFLQNPYTLNQVSTNDTAFLNGDFSQGGFEAWLSASINPANNPFGSRNLAERELQNRLNSAVGRVHQELGWGNGFFSFRGDCSPGTSTAGVDAGNDFINGGTQGTTQTSGVNLSNTNDCFNQPVRTPGSVIAGQINHSLGLGADSLVQADQFDEIVNALMGQLLNNVLGATGLGGLSQGSSASSGRDYFNQTSSPTGTSAGVAVVSAFTQILDSQTTQIQAYQANWQKINAAALEARTAMQSSSCVPNAQAIIASQINPVITQAATVSGSIATAISAIDRIRSQALGAVSLSTAQQTSVLSSASSEYQVLLAGNTLPSTSDLTFAAQQSLDTGNTSPASLYTQMRQITTQARCGT